MTCCVLELIGSVAVIDDTVPFDVDDSSAPAVDSSQQPLVQLDAPAAPALTHPLRIRRPINWNRADPFTV